MDRSIKLLVFFMLPFLAWGQGRDDFLKLKKFSRENDPTVTVINAVKINTSTLEFSPVIYQNGIVYVSQYKQGLMDEQRGETFYEIFYAELDAQGLPMKPEPFSVELNSQYYEGPVSFSRDGKKIYFTRSDMYKGITKSDSGKKTQLKIYEATKGYFDWENVWELPFNDTKYSCLHPSLSADGNKLFFASNMSGGYGGMDLYFVQVNDGRWSQPINLGPEINTSGNEIFPFIHESGILFFTSDGHKSFGGLDLFMIDISSSQWGKVLNLGSPFNSEEDDLSIILNEDGTKGYFASSRKEGAGRDDIYMFTAPNGIRGLLLNKTVDLKVKVADLRTERQIAGAVVRFFERNDKGEIDDASVYSLELQPAEDVDNKLVFNRVRKPEDKLQTPFIATDEEGVATLQLPLGKDFQILVSKGNYEGEEFTYSTKEAEPEAEISVKLKPSECITLNGSVKVKDYNISVPNALIKLINLCTDVEIEFATDINGEFQYCLPIGCDFKLIGEKEGYFAGTSSVSTQSIRGRRSAVAEILLTPESEQIIREPIKMGTVIVLENIYYDFNKSNIRAGAAHDLEALAALMKRYPSMEIELGAHTDSRGQADYNLALSLKRAESAKRFLEQQGISGQRITTFGYGEKFLRNKCGDEVSCTEEEHQYNRRTEVRIIKINESVNVEYNSNNH